MLEADDKKFAANNKFEMFLHNIGQTFFNIRVCAFIRGSIFFLKFAWKIGIFGVQTGEWAFNRDFTVLYCYC